MDARLRDCPACGASPLVGTPEPARLVRFAPAFAFGAIAGLGLLLVDEPELADLPDGHVLAAIDAIPGAACGGIAAREPLWGTVVETVTCESGDRYRIELAADARVRAMPHR